MGKIYKQLTIEERTMIQTQLAMGIKPVAIALELNRSASTISRELHRNDWTRPKAWRGVALGVLRSRAATVPRLPISAPVPARSHRALNAACGQEPHCGIMSHGICKWAIRPSKLPAHWRLRIPKRPPSQASHETIYTAIYAMPRGELRTEVVSWLRFGHAKRRPRARGEDRRGRIPDMVSIHDRPPEVEERLVPGHWEGDLIKGAYNRSAVGTLVERTTLFTVLSRMSDASAEAALSGFSHVLNRIDAQKRLSLTYDQGREMAAHRQLTEATGVKVYFADPHSPWQRGINENTNGLLRQYLPKGSDLSVFTQEELDAIAWQLNTRPRKSLGFKCPAELFTPDAFNFKQHHAALFALGH